MSTLDIASIINNTKKDFTRDRASVIKDFLYNNNNTVIMSFIKKARGNSIKFYYIKDERMVTSDIVIKNAKTLIKAFLKNNIELYCYKNNTVTPYNSDFLNDIK